MRDGGHFNDCDHCYYSGCSCASRWGTIVGISIGLLMCVMIFTIGG